MKKFVSILLALVLALSMTAALASEPDATPVPKSPTTDQNVIPTADPANGVIYPADTKKSTASSGSSYSAPAEAITLGGASEFGTTVLNDLTALDEEGKAGSYFADAGVAENAKVAEVVNLAVLKDAASYAPYTFVINTTTAVPAGTEVIVLIGCTKDGEATWFTANAVATADNAVTVTLDAAQLQAMADADNVVMVVMVPAA